MRILLTGSTGFVGRAFTGSLSEGDEVVSLSRKGEARDDIKVDITNFESVLAVSKQITGDFDALVHLAAYVPKTHSEDRLKDASEVNVTGLVNVLAAFEGRLKKVILGSTAEVYDQSKITGVIDEDSPVNPGSYYGVTKLASEFIAITHGKKRDITTIVLRFSIMYGPNDQIARAIPNFIKAALNGSDIIVRGGSTMRDYIHIEDVVSSLHCALRSNDSGLVNIGTGKGVAIENVARTIVEHTNSSSKVIIEEGSSTDIVINPEKAKFLIGFEAKLLFPDKIDDMIATYR